MIFTIISYYNKSIENEKNIVWLNNVQNQIIDKFYMKYDEDVLEELDYLTKSEYLNASQIEAIKKSTTKSKEVSSFRSKYKNNNPLIFKESKHKFSTFNIKENFIYIYLINFTNLDDFLVNIKFESETCKFELNTTGFQHRIEDILVDPIVNCLYNKIQNISGKTILVGPDHAYTEILLKIFKRLKPDSKIGVVVFDEHIDVYNTKDTNNILGKENVFGKNLVERNIDKIIFIGVSPDHDRNLTGYFAENFTKTDILDKIDFYYDVEYKNKNFKALLSKSIKKMKEECVSNIIFSIDVDILPEDYTGFEYSILAPAMSLGKYYKYYYDLPVQHLGSVSFEDPFFRGLTTEEIIDTINFIKQETIKYNIAIGFDIYNTTLVGDIEELLPEQDLNFKTTEAAVKIANILTQ